MCAKFQTNLCDFSGYFPTLFFKQFYRDVNCICKSSIWNCNMFFFFFFFRYSFAIVGINLTALAYKLVMDGCAKSHFFNVCASSPVESERTPLLKHFHHFYSYLFVEFDKFWLSEKPKDVMEFNRIRDLFENNIRTLLEDRSAHFKINITVDTVWI